MIDYDSKCLQMYHSWLFPNQAYDFLQFRMDSISYFEPRIKFFASHTKLNLKLNLFGQDKNKVLPFST